MFDKVDLRVPAQTPVSKELQPTIKLLQYGPAAGFRPSRFYAAVGDLRQSHGIDAVLHLGYKHGSGDHKLEIIDAGKKSLDEIASTASKVFDVDPWILETMRVDLTADVPGVPVSWFREHARFRFKQFASDISKAGKNEMEFIGMGTAVAQSLYAGRRPNCMRIYDKFAELYRQWLKLKQACTRYNRQLQDFDFTEEQIASATRNAPTFEEFCLQEGFVYKPGASLTRVERQIGGDRIPIELYCLHQYRKADEYNPFESLQIIASEPIIDYLNPPPGVSIRDWLAIIGLLTVTLDCGGVQQAHAFVQKYGNGNGKRVLESLLSQMPASRPAVTIDEIVANYRQSTEMQIFGIRPGSVYSGATYEKANAETA